MRRFVSFLMCLFVLLLSVDVSSLAPQRFQLNIEDFKSVHEMTLDSSNKEEALYYQADTENEQDFEQILKEELKEKQSLLISRKEKRIRKDNEVQWGLLFQSLFLIVNGIAAFTGFMVGIVFTILTVITRSVLVSTQGSVPTTMIQSSVANGDNVSFNISYNSNIIWESQTGKLTIPKGESLAILIGGKEVRLNQGVYTLTGHILPRYEHEINLQVSLTEYSFVEVSEIGDVPTLKVWTTTPQLKEGNLATASENQTLYKIDNEGNIFFSREVFLENSDGNMKSLSQTQTKVNLPVVQMSQYSLPDQKVIKNILANGQSIEESSVQFSIPTDSLITYDLSTGVLKIPSKETLTVDFEGKSFVFQEGVYQFKGTVEPRYQHQIEPHVIMDQYKDIDVSLLTNIPPIDVWTRTKSLIQGQANDSDVTITYYEVQSDGSIHFNQGVYVNNGENIQSVQSLSFPVPSLNQTVYQFQETSSSGLAGNSMNVSSEGGLSSISSIAHLSRFGNESPLQIRGSSNPNRVFLSYNPLENRKEVSVWDRKLDETGKNVWERILAVTTGNNSYSMMTSPNGQDLITGLYLCSYSVEEDGGGCWTFISLKSYVSPEFSNDSSRLLVRDSQNVYIYQKSNEEWSLTHTIDISGKGCQFAKFSPDGNSIVLGGNNGEVEMYAYADEGWSQTHTLHVANSEVTLKDVDFVATGDKMVFGGNEGFLRVWKESDGDWVQDSAVYGGGGVINEVLFADTSNIFIKKGPYGMHYSLVEEQQNGETSFVWQRKENNYMTGFEMKKESDNSLIIQTDSRSEGSLKGTYLPYHSNLYSDFNKRYYYLYEQGQWRSLIESEYQVNQTGLAKVGENQYVFNSYDAFHGNDFDLLIGELTPSSNNQNNQVVETLQPLGEVKCISLSEVKVSPQDQTSSSYLFASDSPFYSQNGKGEYQLASLNNQTGQYEQVYSDLLGDMSIKEENKLNVSLEAGSSLVEENKVDYYSTSKLSIVGTGAVNKEVLESVPPLKIIADSPIHWAKDPINKQGYILTSDKTFYVEREKDEWVKVDTKMYFYTVLAGENVINTESLPSSGSLDETVTLMYQITSDTVIKKDDGIFYQSNGVVSITTEKTQYNVTNLFKVEKKKVLPSKVTIPLLSIGFFVFIVCGINFLLMFGRKTKKRNRSQNETVELNDSFALLEIYSKKESLEQSESEESETSFCFESHQLSEEEGLKKKGSQESLNSDMSAPPSYDAVVGDDDAVLNCPILKESSCECFQAFLFSASPVASRKESLILSAA